jgi:hypothetical protein
MIGRGTRTTPGKDDCLVLDVVGNAVNHKLITLPSIYGGAARVTGRVAKQVAQESKPRKIRLRQAGKSRVIDAGYSQLHWLALTEEDYIISGKEIGTLRLCFNTEKSQWELQEVHKGCVSIIKTFNSQGEAVLASETYAIGQCNNPACLMPEAQWRKARVTKKQRETLVKMGLNDLDDISCGEASDIMSAQFTRYKLAKILGPKDKNYVDEEGIVHGAMGS